MMVILVMTSRKARADRLVPHFKRDDKPAALAALQGQIGFSRIAGRVETPHIVAVFTNRGARLKSWRLKAYKDNHGDPLELVATELASTQPLPFSLQVPDPAATGTLNGALYKLQGTVPEGIQTAPTSQSECRLRLPSTRPRVSGATPIRRCARRSVAAVA